MTGIRTAHRGSASGHVSLHRMPRHLVCILLTFSFAPWYAAAQTLRGRVLEDGGDVPVAGATISLLDGHGERRTIVISDSLGRFTLAPPEPGEYFVHAQRIGYAPTVSVLFEFGMDGSVPFEILMRPLPVGLAGLEVSVDRRAEEMLRPLGLSPETLRNRWIDRATIEKMGMPGGPKDLLRWQNIVGLWVVEPPPLRPPSLCVTFRRGRGCALVLLNGVPVPLGEAYWLDPHTFEAVAVLTPAEATTLYGTRAAGGAVVIWSRVGGR